MAGLVYVLCAATSALCAWLLLRAYAASRSWLLFWSALCFVCLTASNAFLVLDRLVFPTVDLSLWRLLPAFVGMVILLYGLIWHAE